MRSYLLIESRGEYESPDVTALFELAVRLCDLGHRVAVFLIQNAVVIRDQSAADLAARGVTVWVDEYSIAARGLDPQRCPPGVRLGGVPELVRMLMAGDTVPVWH